MSYYADMSPYDYGGRAQPGVVHVGWLDGEHPYPRGAVPSQLLDKMKELARTPVELYRGFHICEVCKWSPKKDEDNEQAFLKWEELRQSNGAIRVTAKGITYAAPVLVIHYIEAHEYLPPKDFLRAIESWPHKWNDDTHGESFRKELETLVPSRMVKKRWWEFWK
jgi:hypothetical protein